MTRIAPILFFAIACLFSLSTVAAAPVSHVEIKLEPRQRPGIEFAESDVPVPRTFLGKPYRIMRTRRGGLAQSQGTADKLEDLAFRGRTGDGDGNAHGGPEDMKGEGGEDDGGDDHEHDEDDEYKHDGSDNADDERDATRADQFRSRSSLTRFQGLVDQHNHDPV